MDLVEIAHARRRIDADQLALVLAAVGIGCTLRPDGRGVAIAVTPEEAPRAIHELTLYRQENAPPPSRPLGLRPFMAGLDAALAYCALLLLLFACQTRGIAGIDWTSAGAVQAGLIRGGAWWRAVTGLTLHGDLAHLWGNLGFGVLFGMMVSQLFGAGLGWLAILAAGAGGNLLNVAMHGPGHTAVGASTALFGAVGILSAYIWRRHPVPWRGGIRRFAPLSGGLLLLVFLGTTGERTDIGAHLSGFLAGCLVGLLLARYDDRLPRGQRAQWLYGLAALGLIGLAWMLALVTPGQPFSP